MNVLGIVRTHGLELVDVEIREGSLFSASCPASLPIACNHCAYSVSAGTAPGQDEPATAKKRKSVPLLLCYWHEQQRPGP